MSWEHCGEPIFSHKMVTCHWPQPWYLEQSMSHVMSVMMAVIRDNTIEMDGAENV